LEKLESSLALQQTATSPQQCLQQRLLEKLEFSFGRQQATRRLHQKLEFIFGRQQAATSYYKAPASETRIQFRAPTDGNFLPQYRRNRSNLSRLPLQERATQKLEFSFAQRQTVTSCKHGQQKPNSSFAARRPLLQEETRIQFRTPTIGKLFTTNNVCLQPQQPVATTQTQAAETEF
jgi:hypothetical protein